MDDVLVPGPTTTVALRAGRRRTSDTLMGLPWNQSGAVRIENFSGESVNTILDVVDYLR